MLRFILVALVLNAQVAYGQVEELGAKYARETTVNWIVSAAKINLHDANPLSATRVISRQNTNELNVEVVLECDGPGEGASIALAVQPKDKSDLNFIETAEGQEGRFYIAKTLASLNDEKPQPVSFLVWDQKNRLHLGNIIKSSIERHSEPGQNTIDVMTRAAATLNSKYMNPTIPLDKFWKLQVEFHTDGDEGYVKIPLHSSEVFELLRSCE